MIKNIMMGYNRNSRKLTPWQPHLARLTHITKVQVAFDTETKKMRILKKLAVENNDAVVEATVTAKDIQDEIASAQKARRNKEAAELAAMDIVDGEQEQTVEQMNASLEATDTAKENAAKDNGDKPNLAAPKPSLAAPKEVKVGL